MSKPHKSRLDRRTFVVSAVAAGSALALPACAGGNVPAITLSTGDTVLFQGDSITDAGRNREKSDPNDRAALGGGYPLFLAGDLLADHAALNLKVYNRGISGNTVPDLAARWEADALDLNPAVLSILIGVNDIWHKLNGQYNGTVEDYEAGYRDLLLSTITALPDVRIVICEPFVLRCGAVNDRWFPEFDQRRAVAAKLAQELKLIWVPFQSMFDEAVKQAPPEYWASDGVHPTVAGHALMAETWRKVTGL